MQIGLMQFSNGVHVQTPLGEFEDESFGKTVADMVIQR